MPYYFKEKERFDQELPRKNLIHRQNFSLKDYRWLGQTGEGLAHTGKREKWLFHTGFSRASARSEQRWGEEFSNTGKKANEEVVCRQL